INRSHLLGDQTCVGKFRYNTRQLRYMPDADPFQDYLKHSVQRALGDCMMRQLMKYDVTLIISVFAVNKNMIAIVVLALDHLSVISFSASSIFSFSLTLLS